MQPYFLPYFEQFRLMAACDLWVVFDTAQYTRKSWMNRNRILNRDKGWSYIHVPVRQTGLATTVGQALIDERQDWRSRLLDQLRIYAHEAPHHGFVLDLLDNALRMREPALAQLNTTLLRAVADTLGIATPMRLASSLPLDWDAPCAPGEWALRIARHLGAKSYRNASGGRALFDPALYASQGVELTFHTHHARRYHTGSFAFVADLSVVDWLMWNDHDQLRSWLD